jgi:hypothetical protein
VSGMRERASRDVAALVQRAVNLRRLIELADEHAQDPSPELETMADRLGDTAPRTARRRMS